jgi:hypothetical protein
LPIVFRMSTVALAEPARAAQYAADVAALCRQVSVTSADRSLWMQAAELLEKIYVSREPGGELVSYTNTLDPEHYDVLRRIGYLGATLQTDCTPEKAIQAHLAIMPFVFRLFEPPSTTYRRIVLPFIDVYWMTTFQKTRFRFRSPRMVADSLVKAQSEPEFRRAQAVLGTMLSGLDVKPPAEVQKWLYTDTRK